MCDPITLGVGIVGGLAAKKLLTPKTPAMPSMPDPAAERAAAEASAATAANAQIVDAKRAKQLNALAMGGDSTAALGKSKSGSTVLGGGAAVSAF